MIRRIELILKTQNISPAQFADRLGIQRSGLSHILSGRNKPSLDFVLKVLNQYPEINSDWLLFGKGNMYSNQALPTQEHPIQGQISLFDLETPKLTESKESKESEFILEEEVKDVFDWNDEQALEKPLGQEKGKLESLEPEQIVFFYKDGSFKAYPMKR